MRAKNFRSFCSYAALACLIGEPALGMLQGDHGKSGEDKRKVADVNGVLPRAAEAALLKDVDFTAKGQLPGEEYARKAAEKAAETALLKDVDFTAKGQLPGEEYARKAAEEATVKKAAAAKKAEEEAAVKKAEEEEAEQKRKEEAAAKKEEEEAAAKKVEEEAAAKKAEEAAAKEAEEEAAAKKAEEAAAKKAEEEAEAKRKRQEAEAEQKRKEEEETKRKRKIQELAATIFLGTTEQKKQKITALQKCVEHVASGEEFAVNSKKSNKKLEDIDGSAYASIGNLIADSFLAKNKCAVLKLEITKSYKAMFSILYPYIPVSELMNFLTKALSRTDTAEDAIRIFALCAKLDFETSCVHVGKKQQVLPTAPTDKSQIKKLADWLPVYYDIDDAKKEKALCELAQLAMERFLELQTVKTPQ
jgi:chemotaxis protein histidine kinase CheA